MSSAPINRIAVRIFSSLHSGRSIRSATLRPRIRHLSCARSAMNSGGTKPAGSETPNSFSA
ncbi:MAG: hypothetical protein A2061_03225 [Gallionellales bacterium GWA2_59_43]|nr:MAG: hypothetical protein A2061_03225 [Gallionellales bacterium GWA2_59_43]